ncbi:MAG TPA: MerR family transcriptional regulator [Candidatus Syntrophoarchaeum butanivorans]|uniref:MerR family transcriptional regulator n=2 Tax=Candidatus Syntropharchaeum butanivorans TaxID=1839936 RepID=A0A1F2P371_9EURY|nr:MAG: hypothetical protein SBU_001526 [Candidatus Syntrophoarchaeum butanivorans]RJS71593.1 MAG: MerR family transcriptional regulator [Candidatus Syntrophoarchaeum sp. WYZ-LMO15]HDM36987.1 MerR family transcriptional regulator [Candidatus Syntrophoarchaeum butanivorans]HEC57211.1 MerR family transcriptional regulator [Candidatus Syntrophoarchaeum butanivorans]
MMRVVKKEEIILSPIYTEIKRSGLLSLDELCDICSLHPDLVRRYMEIGIITPDAEILDEPFFSGDTIRRLRKIQRIRRDLGVNLIGIEIILNLLDEIEELRREIRYLRRRLI